MPIFLISILLGAFTGVMTEKTLNYGSLKTCIADLKDQVVCEKITREKFSGKPPAEQYKN